MSGGITIAGLAMSVVLACGPPAAVDGGLDAGASDGGLRDAAAPDAGPARDGGPRPSECTIPPLEGTTGARCRDDRFCDPRSSCVEGVVWTLDLATGIPDPDRPGELLAGPPSTIPVVFAPDGMCTTPCQLAEGDDEASCGPCAACSAELGGAHALGEIGVSVGSFIDLADGEGVCRGRCVFDAETGGGCPGGFTCDVDSNVCLERCVDDQQCRLRFGATFEGEIVIYTEGDAVCDAATGRCRWSPPAGAAFGSACARDEDCPRDVGRCLFGLCTTLQCRFDGGGPHPCPAGARCYQTDADPGICMATCTSIDDCPRGRVCKEADDGGSPICSPVCDADHPCRADERCFAIFADPALGHCRPFCDATGAGLAGATVCAADEGCRRVPDRDFGSCVRLGGRCLVDDDCVGDQRCASGRCATP